MAKNTVFIYSDTGCADITNLKNKLVPYFSARDISVAEISARELVHSRILENNALALFMPGGVAGAYFNSIGIAGNNKIKQFIWNGGIYFGICAGAYYACKNVEFETDIPSSCIRAQYNLNLVDAVARGTLYKQLNIKPFSNKPESASVVKLYGKNITKKFAALYHGGPYFDIDDNDVSVLANYKFGRKKLPAILEKNFGSGKVLLSGVHFETAFADFRPMFYVAQTNKDFAKLLTDLKCAESGRSRLFNYLMAHVF